jgi:hypothetical protein
VLRRIGDRWLAPFRSLISRTMPSRPLGGDAPDGGVLGCDQGAVRCCEDTVSHSGIWASLGESLAGSAMIVAVPAPRSGYLAANLGGGRPSVNDGLGFRSHPCEAVTASVSREGEDASPSPLRILAACRRVPQGKWPRGRRTQDFPILAACRRESQVRQPNRQVTLRLSPASGEDQADEEDFVRGPLASRTRRQAARMTEEPRQVRPQPVRYP